METQKQQIKQTHKNEQHTTQLLFFLLLTGKPSSFKKVRELFVKNLPVSPDRIISLNKYRVGRWYPFSDDIGYFSDTKTIVSVGALIALMSERLEKLSGFRLKLDHLKEKLISISFLEENFGKKFLIN